MTGEPKVAAIGGGHGLAVTLRALRRITSDITAVVSVADDGGSTGRLRAAMGLPALGDLRKCLAALASDASPLTAVLDHRFEGGELDGHAFGNLLMAALARTSEDLVEALDRAGRLCEIVGRLLPATEGPVTLIGETASGREVSGQVAVMATEGITRVRLAPATAAAPRAVLDAVRGADLVVIGPGSLFTSVLAAVVAPGIREALAATHAHRVFVCNLAAQPPETAGFDVADHVAALTRHDVVVDEVLYDPSRMVGADAVPHAVAARLASDSPRLHAPELLAAALSRCLVGREAAPIGSEGRVSGRIVAD